MFFACNFIFQIILHETVAFVLLFLMYSFSICVYPRCFPPCIAPHFRRLLMHRCWPRDRGKSWTSIFDRDTCISNSKFSSELWWWEDRGWIWPRAWWLLVVYQQLWATPGSPRQMRSSFHFLQTTVLDFHPHHLSQSFLPSVPLPWVTAPLSQLFAWLPDASGKPGQDRRPGRTFGACQGSQVQHSTFPSQLRSHLFSECRSYFQNDRSQCACVVSVSRVWECVWIYVYVIVCNTGAYVCLYLWKPLSLTKINQ